MDRVTSPAPVRPAFWQCLLPALLSGGLLWACHFPLAWGWLGWVALAPFLTLVRSPARPWKVYLAAWLGAYGFFVAALEWMRYADERMVYTWVLLALYCSLYYLLGLFLLRLLDRRTRLPLVVTVPVVWTALEFLRSFFLGGFAWYYLAHTQHDALPVIQIADVTGLWGVTVVVAAVNAVLCEWLCRVAVVRRLLGLPDDRPPASPVPLVWQTAGVLVLLGGVLGYGVWQLGRREFTDGPRVALIQGNVPQEIRNKGSHPDEEISKPAGQIMYAQYDLLSTIAGLGQQQPVPDLTVWPETCYPDEWTAVDPAVPPDQVPDEQRRWMAEERALASQAPVRWHTNVLLGINFRRLGTDGKLHRRNSSLLIVNGEAVARYDKMHLVPFGEYVPFVEWLPFMDVFNPYGFDYSVQPGDGQTRFRLGQYTFGAVICYEDSDPFLARRLVLPGGDAPPVNFVINSSNDGWFKGSSEHEEHLAVARFRAVECRRPLLRAVNMGISAVVDADGRVLPPRTADVHQVQGEWANTFKTVPLWEAKETPDGASLPPDRWHEFKATHGVLTAVLPLDHRPSLYAAWGDWLPLLCWAAVILAVAWAVWRPRRPEVES